MNEILFPFQARTINKIRNQRLKYFFLEFNQTFNHIC